MWSNESEYGVIENGFVDQESVFQIVSVVMTISGLQSVGFY